MSNKVLVGGLLVALVAMALFAMWTAILGWNLEGEVEMSGHGWAAMAIGVVASFGVGIGLMALAFHSARTGHDEDAQRNQVLNPEDRDHKA